MSIKVLQFFASLDNGGAENRMMDVYSHIDSSIVSFDFAVLEEKNHYFDDKVKKKNSEKIVFPNPKKGLIRNYKALNRFFKNNKEVYHAVHTHVSWYSGVVLFSAKKAGIPNRIAHSRGWIRKNRSLKERIFMAVGKFLIRISATERLAISEEAGEFLYGKSAVKSGKCKVIPNSVDEAKYRVLSDQEKQMIRQQFTEDSDTRLFVNVANLRAIKNHSFLLDIAYELKNRNYPFRLCLIGEGDQRKAIEKKVSELQLEEHVILLGNRSDVPEILGAFDGMIFPSLSEGFGGVVLEAQLVGVPVIASDMVPGFTDMGAGMVKYLSLDQSSSEWADEIIAFFGQNFSWTRETMLEEMKKRHFTIESTAREYLKAYRIDEATINRAII